jgi:hypothetical protein
MTATLSKSTISIDKLSFDLPGKITLQFKDGRIFIVPLKYFPEIKSLKTDQRKKYTIVDDRTILFSHLDSIYHLEDFIGLEAKWKER